MSINAIMPAIEFLMHWFRRYVKRAWDQRSLFPGDYSSTRCKSVQEFTDLYSGADFHVHMKYSYILSVVYIAFIFGPLMPILFVSSTASLLCLYTVEKLAMSFSYKKPPMYDHKITDYVLRMLIYAPILYAISSIWVFSN